MDLGFNNPKMQQYKALVVKFLGDPLKMRLAVLVTLVGAAVGGVYMPLSDRIDEARAKVAAENTRLDYIKETETLRREVQGYVSRINDRSDTNEWVQYLLGGSRITHVKLRDMETKEPQKVGPYKTVSLVVELEGTYPQLKAFVEWLEQSDRLLRVENVRFEKQPGNLMMKVFILGLVRKNA